MAHNVLLSLLYFGRKTNNLTSYIFKSPANIYYNNIMHIELKTKEPLEREEGGLIYTRMTRRAIRLNI